MSAKTKARAKIKRSGEKRARKATLKAQYQAWARDGVTKGSKRQRSKKAIAKKLLNPRKGGRTRIALSLVPWTDKQGNLLPGAPHRAYLEWRKTHAAA
jgi:hypothetical protein